MRNFVSTKENIVTTKVEKDLTRECRKKVEE